MCARAYHAQPCINVHGPLALADPLCCSVSSRHFYSDRPRQTICGGKTIINLSLLVFISLAPVVQLTHYRTESFCQSLAFLTNFEWTVQTVDCEFLLCKVSCNICIVKVWIKLLMHRDRKWSKGTGRKYLYTLNSKIKLSCRFEDTQLISSGLFLAMTLLWLLLVMSLLWPLSSKYNFPPYNHQIKWLGKISLINLLIQKSKCCHIVTEIAFAQLVLNSIIFRSFCWELMPLPLQLALMPDLELVSKIFSYASGSTLYPCE